MGTQGNSVHSVRATSWHACPRILTNETSCTSELEKEPTTLPSKGIGVNGPRMIDLVDRSNAQSRDPTHK